MKTCNYCHKSKEFHNFYQGRGKCKECFKSDVRKYRLSNPEKVKECDLRWRVNNRDLILEDYRERSKMRRHNKPKETKHSRDLWVTNNREIYKNAQKAWRDSHKHVLKEYSAKRRAFRKNACPGWLNNAQLIEIKHIYQNCPSDMEVDHIVPLQGKNVCGLHVPWNLQYLSVSANRSKGNRLNQ